MNIVGYYVDEYGDKTCAKDVFVCIRISDDGGFEYYCPVGQHGEGMTGYLKYCKEITKEEYLKASMGLYTPSDYL
ncbi:hypothetical protein PQE75_gp046 [Bacillus phage vB_BcoS-136]|uniref:Uncharacterized protein n=1 Tax=Bacillus phage vB_BcoS-136 TaxID=2419619 RepID=A0A3G3BVB9_9CAUD|nr:hypothetical protein PQE75_gp046 [Bacillus phage vB_BcoS-136]AYP68178.1 hypothetical protein vBBcoS136_00046 [Bacillus phage vB_BcoS-136]